MYYSNERPRTLYMAAYSHISSAPSRPITLCVNDVNKQQYQSVNNARDKIVKTPESVF